MSGPSRLAFTMPPDLSEVPYTLAGVLSAMRSWAQSLDVAALPDPARKAPTSVRPRPPAHAARIPLRRAKHRRAGRGLEQAGAEGVHEAILGAVGERVADRAAGALSGGASRIFGETTMRLMQTELDGLQESFSVLRSGRGHKAGIAAVALATASSLGRLAGRLRPGVDLIAEVPYLPLLLVPRPPADTATARSAPLPGPALSDRGGPLAASRWSRRAPRTHRAVAHTPAHLRRRPVPTGSPRCGRCGRPTTRPRLLRH